jgi:hypothetical protein
VLCQPLPLHSPPGTSTSVFHAAGQGGPGAAGGVTRQDAWPGRGSVGAGSATAPSATGRTRFSHRRSGSRGRDRPGAKPAEVPSSDLRPLVPAAGGRTVRGARGFLLLLRQLQRAQVGGTRWGCRNATGAGPVPDQVCCGMPYLTAATQAHAERGPEPAALCPW